MKVNLPHLQFISADTVVWGTIVGNINDQTDLTDFIKNNIDTVIAPIIQDIDGKIDAIEAEISVINVDISGIHSTITVIFNEISDIYSNIAITNNTVTVIENKITSIEGDISNIQSEVGNLDSELSALDNRVTTNENKITSIENKITDIEGDITTIQGDITTINSDISALENKITVIEGDITTIQGDITTIENKITDIEGDITTINSDISTINTSLSTKVTDVLVNGTSVVNSSKVAEIDLTDIENKITDIDDDITTIENNITTIENKITTIEGDITNINSNISNLSNEIVYIQSDLYTHIFNTTNPHQVTKAQVGLNNVDNIQQEPIHDVEKTDDLVSNDLINIQDSEDSNARKYVVWNYIKNQFRDKNWLPTKSDIGLSNVDNTSDINKPVSTAAQTALSGKVDKSVLPIAMYGISISSQPNELKLFGNKVDTSTGISTTDTINFPIVTDTTLGLMPKEDHQQIAQNTSDIAALKNKTVLYPTNSPLPEALTQQEVIDIFDTVSGGQTPSDGVTLISFDADTYNFEWTYYSLDDTWRFKGNASISIASETQLGVVMGDNTDGKVYVETDGTMSLVGYDDIITDLSGLSDSLNNKIDKTSIENQVYITDASGETTTYGYSSSINESFPIRDGSGNFEVGTPVGDSDAANKGYVDSQVSSLGSNYVKTSGATDVSNFQLTGNVAIWGTLDLKNHKIESVSNPTTSTDVTNKQYVDSGLSNKLDKKTELYKIYGTDNGGAQITIVYTSDNTYRTIPYRDVYGNIGVGTAIKSTDATNKDYVDTLVSSSINDSVISIQKNGTEIDSFTLNQSTDKTIDIEVPTAVSDLTNDSGYVTSSSIGDANINLEFSSIAQSTGTKILGAANQSMDTTTTLHVVAATGNYNDLINAPDIEEIENDISNLKSGLSQAESNITTIQGNLNNKLDKNSTMNIVYGTDSLGYQTSYYINNSASANTIPMRNGSGNIQVGTPVNDSDAATKEYVDQHAGVQSDWNETDNSKLSFILNKPSIPTTTSQLTNNSGFVADASYVHSDNNFTNALLTKLNNITAEANKTCVITSFSENATTGLLTISFNFMPANRRAQKADGTTISATWLNQSPTTCTCFIGTENLADYMLIYY
jgi:predicted  nucleic acid-binding Zn-ribbon protein